MKAFYECLDTEELYKYHSDIYFRINDNPDLTDTVIDELMLLLNAIKLNKNNPAVRRILISQLATFNHFISKKYIDDKIFTFGSVVFNSTKKTIVKNDEIVVLTQTQNDVLMFLVENDSKVISKATFQLKLFGYTNATNSRSIDNYILYLRKLIDYKEDDSSDYKFIKKIKGKGYKLVY